jgi:uncharacterized protein
MSRFAWRDLMSVDPEASSAFFTALCGWTEIPIEIEPFGTYRQLFHGDEVFGGVLALDPAIGHPSHWVSYIDVQIIEAAVAKTARLGGLVASQPSEIPGVGWFATLADKQSVLFCMLQWSADAARPEERSDQPEPGAVAWNELLTADPSSAAAFYGKLFNWQMRTTRLPRGDYRTMLRDGKPEAGIIKRLSGMNMSAWLIYFEVADLDASLAKVAELGERVVSEIIEEEGVGRFPYAADPTEAGFGLVQSARAIDA